MQIKHSKNGDNAGTIKAKIGMIINVDADEGQDEDLADFMEDNDNGACMTISDIDDEGKLLWVEGCEYAIPGCIVWKDI